MAAISFRANIGKVRGLQFSQDGKPRFSFSAAEGHGRYDKQAQQWKDTGTTWYSVTAFGRLAEDLADIIQEGQKQQVVVSGRLETREYEHNGQRGSSLDVVADQVGLVHRAPRDQQGQQSRPAQSQPAPADPWAGAPSSSAPSWDTPQQSEVPF